MYLDYFDKFYNMSPYLYIDNKEWTHITETYERSDIVESLTKVLMTYPLPYADISIEDAQKDFFKLKTIKWRDNLIEGKWTARNSYSHLFEYNGKELYFKKSNTGNDSSNFFQQKNRWKVDATQSPGPDRTWKTERSMRSTVNSFFTLKYTEIDKSNIRSSIALRKYICSQFKPNIAKMFYELFDAKVILDFSAGWGDRLAGFYGASCTETYIGIDPRHSNHPIYKDQVSFYDKNIGWFEKKKSVYLYESPAEDWDNGEWLNKVDLIFTSPPYFNTERYSNDDTQSWVRYKTIDTWNVNFLHKALDNVWMTLKSGGRLIVNISDIYDRSVKKYVNICEPMITHMQTKNDCEYEGVIGMEMAQRPNDHGISDENVVFCEPCWIFKKK